MSRENSSRLLRVSFLRIGSGDAIFIQSPAGNQILIDGGSNNTILGALGSMIPFYNRTLDAVMVTDTSNKNAIGGIPAVLSAYHVVSYFSDMNASSTPTLNEIEKDLLEKKISAHSVVAGVSMAIGGGAILQILSSHPVIIRLAYQNTSFLFLSDANSDAENNLINIYGTGLRSDVIKISNHETESPATIALLALVHPTYAIISYSSQTYNTSHMGIFDYLKKIQSTVIQISSGVEFTSNGTDIEKKQL
jgi:beta-lactamase superfamily II metal-dependent hydrolase